MIGKPIEQVLRAIFALQLGNCIEGIEPFRRLRRIRIWNRRNGGEYGFRPWWHVVHGAFLMRKIGGKFMTECAKGASYLLSLKHFFGVLFLYIAIIKKILP